MTVLKELVNSSESMYPAILEWFKQKVVPGLKSGERLGWVAYESDRAIASAVLKLSKRAKFCHVRIHEDFQDRALGQMFFSQMALDARHHAKEIHFTLPESLWSVKQEFFGSFGFKNPLKSRRQYRNGDVELSCSAPFSTVWASVLMKLPELAPRFTVGGYSLRNKILISIKPQYSQQILAGLKLVEIRKKFSKRWVGAAAVMYSSAPQKALVGEAVITSVQCGSPEEIWSRFGSQTGCTFEEFKNYVGSTNIVSAIEMSNVVPYREPVSLAQVSHLLNEDLRPPQSFCDLRLDDEGSGWAKAVSVASLLHGRFNHIERRNPDLER
jgi:predicted transcriptional regulator